MNKSQMFNVKNPIRQRLCNASQLQVFMIVMADIFIQMYNSGHFNIIWIFCTSAPFKVPGGIGGIS
jgi:hypothetical protein